LTVRTALIRARTQAINVVRTLVRSTGARIPAGATEHFVGRVRRLALPAPLTETIGPLLRVLEALEPEIAAADRAARAQATADATTVRLMTAPGVGPITALHVRATVDQVDRFPTAATVASYVGLVPREHSSGERQRRGGITKAGARATRAVLVQASWVVWRTTRGPGATLAAWAHRLAARRGRKVAVIAIARRLVRILFAMWRDGRDYVEPIAARRVA
jgi:transposase